MFLNFEVNVKLCYIQSPWAFFSTAEEQTGEHWDKSPYEHRSLPPEEARAEYVRVRRDNKGEILRDEKGNILFSKGSEYANGIPKWKLTKIAFEDEYFTTPSERSFLDSGLSVNDINSGKAAWLFDSSTQEKIYAGTTLDEFISTIRRRGGKVYLCEN